MSRSLFGFSLSPVMAWALLNPDRFASPCRALATRKAVFAARVHGVDVRKGDLLALHASHSQYDLWRMRSVVLRLREACDTTLPTEGAPYRALAGRVVAVATLTGATTRTGGDPWRAAPLREALGIDREYWAELSSVLVLPRPVESAGGAGLWSLSGSECFAVMDQVRAIETRAAKGAA